LRIDPAIWRMRAGMPALLDALGAGAGETRVVGGAVRDALLGAPVSDIDLATRLKPETVVARLEAAGLKAVPTGLRHGTITAIAAGTPYEVTTLRSDLETDGRHAVVAFTDDWMADAARRDFTINALYADPVGGAVFDWFGGAADLAARRVRFIGDPLTRIAEDHLRILRFFRFSARLGGSLDPDGLAACGARAKDLLTLSRERVREELLKLLETKDPAPTIEAMRAAGVLASVLPEAGPTDRLMALVAAEADAGVSGDGLRRLAALLPEDPGVADKVAARLRLSNAARARLAGATTPGAVPQDPRALAYAIGAEVAIDRLLLTGDSRAAAWAPRLAAWKRPRMPLSGKDLIAMGLVPGPAVSRAMKAVEAGWIAAGFPTDRASAERIARTVLGLV
jgi:poly(A) polymerase